MIVHREDILNLGRTVRNVLQVGFQDHVLVPVLAFQFNPDPLRRFLCLMESDASSHVLLRLVLKSFERGAEQLVSLKVIGLAFFRAVSGRVTSLAESRVFLVADDARWYDNRVEDVSRGVLWLRCVVGSMAALNELISEVKEAP